MWNKLNPILIGIFIFIENAYAGVNPYEENRLDALHFRPAGGHLLTRAFSSAELVPSISYTPGARLQARFALWDALAVDTTETYDNINNWGNPEFGANYRLGGLENDFFSELFVGVVPALTPNAVSTVVNLNSAWFWVWGDHELRAVGTLTLITGSSTDAYSVYASTVLSTTWDYRYHLGNSFAGLSLIVTAPYTSNTVYAAGGIVAVNQPLTLSPRIHAGYLLSENFLTDLNLIYNSSAQVSLGVGLTYVF